MNFTMLTAALDKDAGLDMDLMARMSVIEGALGRRAGELSKDRRSIGAALKEIPLQYPAIDHDWFALKDWGLYDALVQGARKVLPHQGGVATAEEVAQELAGGLGRGGAQRDSIFRNAGKKLSDLILSGRATPKSLWGTLRNWAMKRALNVWDKMRRRDKQRGDGALVQDEGQMSVDDAIDTSPMALLFTLMGTSKGNAVKRWMYKTVADKGTPAQAAIMDAVIDNPTAGPSELSRILGDQSSQNISNHLGRIQKLLVNEMESDAAIRNLIENEIEMGLDLQDLARGHVRWASDQNARFWQKLRFAAVAYRVAFRYLNK